MKLWEVIKELTEDPTKKFEKFEQREPDWVETIGWEDGFLIYTSEFRGEVIDRGGITENADLNESDWQLVRQPVTWQEAIQVWADGKKVAWEEDADRRVFDRNKSWPISKYQNHLLDQEGDAVTVRMISGGKWYAED